MRKGEIMALVIEVKVSPGAKKYCWALDKSDILKCCLKSQAEQGKANAELIKNLARDLGVSQIKISIIGGSFSRKKRIKIDIDLSYDQLLEKLGIQKQLALFGT